jgi:threonine/homoserine/homoserine lactone efflux protein
MDLSNILYFIAACMLLTIAPGPDILFVIAQSISHGRKAGIATALGLCSGVTVHTLAAALGISAILHQSTLAFQILKYAGACYLLFLAWQALRERKQPLSAVQVSKKSMGALFRRGIFMNVLNPKVSLFFLALLPQFVTPGTMNPSLQMIVLGLIFMVQAIFIFSIVAFFAGSFGKKVLSRPRVAYYVNTAKAGLFAIIGIRLAMAEK